MLHLKNKKAIPIDGASCIVIPDEVFEALVGIAVCFAIMTSKLSELSDLSFDKIVVLLLLHLLYF